MKSRPRVAASSSATRTEGSRPPSLWDKHTTPLPSSNASLSVRTALPTASSATAVAEGDHTPVPPQRRKSTRRQPLNLPALSDVPPPVAPDPLKPLPPQREYALSRLKSSWESLIERYSATEFVDDDEIDLNDLTIVEPRGFLEQKGGQQCGFYFGNLTRYLAGNAATAAADSGNESDDGIDDASGSDGDDDDGNTEDGDDDDDEDDILIQLFHIHATELRRAAGPVPLQPLMEPARATPKSRRIVERVACLPITIDDDDDVEDELIGPVTPGAATPRRPAATPRTDGPPIVTPRMSIVASQTPSASRKAAPIPLGDALDTPVHRPRASRRKASPVDSAVTFTSIDATAVGPATAPRPTEPPASAATATERRLRSRTSARSSSSISPSAAPLPPPVPPPPSVPVPPPAAKPVVVRRSSTRTSPPTVPVERKTRAQQADGSPRMNADKSTLAKKRTGKADTAKKTAGKTRPPTISADKKRVDKSDPPTKNTDKTSTSKKSADKTKNPRSAPDTASPTPGRPTRSPRTSISVTLPSTPAPKTVPPAASPAASTRTRSRSSGESPETAKGIAKQKRASRHRDEDYEEPTKRRRLRSSPALTASASATKRK